MKEKNTDDKVLRVINSSVASVMSLIRVALTSSINSLWYFLLFTCFGIEEAKVNRQTFFIVVLTAAAANKLYIHIDIVTVGVYEILPKTTEKNIWESSCTQADEYGKKILRCVKYLLWMFFKHVRNSIKRSRVCVRLPTVDVWVCNWGKFLLSSILIQRCIEDSVRFYFIELLRA